MRLVDVHCHLQSELLRPELPRIMREAGNAEISKLITNATSPADWNVCKTLHSEYPECYFALGIHPWYIPDEADLFLSSLTDADFNGAVAIGEIGLDSKHTNCPMDIQIRIFRKQLSIAADLGLPSIIHCMGAWSELDSALKAVPVKRGGIIHNFNGSEELARSLSKLGISFSMGGTLTYRDSVKRERMLKSIYPDHFLLETDSPDIPPIEKRGLTNEPAYIRYSLSAASEILSVSEELIAESTSRNADNIFFS